MAGISLKNINKSFGDTQVIKNLDLEIKDGEFMVFVGPSGCGKSTVLRMIAGLETVTQGELRIGKQLMNNVHPKDRDIAMVFQSYALYPHMTVFDNIAFGLKIRKIHDDEIKRRVNEASDILGLTPLLERKPKALSGGQRQRVALGRAIVRNPSVFLFDEPLSNLDAELRVQMRAEISKLQRSLKTTTVYVTHDQVEAMTMGHRIAVMRAIGSDTHIITNLTQCGTPLEIYDRPENIFTARFIGTPHMNMIEASISSDGLQVEADGLALPIGEEFSQAAKRIPGRKVMLGIRPEHIGLPDESDWDNTQPISGKVEMVEPLGHEVIVHFRVREKMLQGRLRSHRLLPAFGDEINMQVNCNNIHLFDLASEQRIGFTDKP